MTFHRMISGASGIGVASQQALSSDRDDLRTRSEASGFRAGVRDGSRERREDGADDHTTQGANSESVLGEPRGGSAVSPRRSRINI